MFPKTEINRVVEIIRSARAACDAQGEALSDDERSLVRRLLVDEPENAPGRSLQEEDGSPAIYAYAIVAVANALGVAPR